MDRGKALKKAGAFALAFMMLLSAAMLGGCEKEPESIIKGLIPDQQKEAHVEAAPSFGMVAATDKLTYGLSSAGLLSYTGRSNGRAACYDWRGVAFVLPFGSGTLGLTTDGKVLAAGTLPDEAADAAEAANGSKAEAVLSIREQLQSWSGVAAICAGSSNVYGLTEGGRVLSTTHDGRLAMLRGIVQIAAGGEWFVAADNRGCVYSFGDGAPDVSALQGKELVQLAGGTVPAEAEGGSGSGYLLGVTKDGTLISTLAGDSFNGAADCARAFTCPCGATTYIDKNGVLHSNCKTVADKTADIQAAADAAGKDGKPAKIQWFSCSGAHAALTLENGKVLSFGENDYRQCSTGGWRLLPFISSL